MKPVVSYSTNASLGCHSQTPTQSGVVHGFAARVTTPLRSLVTRATSLAAGDRSAYHTVMVVFRRDLRAT